VFSRILRPTAIGIWCAISSFFFFFACFILSFAADNREPNNKLTRAQLDEVTWTIKKSQKELSVNS